MTTKREIEVRGADVEKAIELGLQKLGVSRSDVIIDVIDEGSRGLLGIGSREVVVRLVSLSAQEPAPKPKPAAQTAVPTPKQQAKPAPKKTETAVAAKSNGSEVEVQEADPEEKEVA